MSGFVMPEHDCFWCGQKTRAMGWACERCYPLKEQAYAQARNKGLTKYQDVVSEVLDVLKENGVGGANSPEDVEV